jgi:hypothetical protein
MNFNGFEINGRKSLVVIALAITSMSLLIAPAYAASPPFVDMINLSNNAGSSFEPRIAASGNNVYVVWRDNTPGNNEIFFKASNNNGSTFNEIINLSNNAGASDSPHIAVSDKNVYVVWQDNTPGNDEVFFSASDNNGSTFSRPVNLSNNAGSSFEPRIAASGNNVYVVWRDRTPGNDEVFFSASDNNGSTFSRPVNLSNNAGNSFEPRIAAYDKNVYVVWRDNTPGNNEIFFSASDNNGSTFSRPINLSNNAGISDSPRIAASDNNVYVVWRDRSSGNDEIFFSASDNNGSTFSRPTNLSNNAGSSFEPNIAASGNNVYVVWRDNTPLNEEIFFKTSNNNGATFNEIINLSSNAGASDSPRIAAYDKNVYVVWRDNTPGNNEIFFSASDNNGSTFSRPINLSNNAGSSDSPRIAVSDNKVYLVWQDRIAVNDEISFRTSIWVTIDSLDNDSPRWDLDAVTVSGRTNAGDSDTIVVEWGDGTSTTGISHSGGSWGPVSHTYGSANVGSNEIVVKLLDTFGDETTSASSTIEVRKHKTSLDIPTLSSRSVMFGEQFSVTANTLIDAETGLGIEGKKITYSGTAVLRNVIVTTGADGGLSAPVDLTAVSEDSVGTGKTVIASFAGDAMYEPSNSPAAIIEILREKVEDMQEKITVKYQDSSFDVMTSLTNGSVKGVEVDPEVIGIILTLETSATDDGELMITLPRALIDSNLNGADDDFVVIVNGNQTDYQEQSTTATERTLTIPIIAGTEEVEIIGTWIVPEFPIAVIAVMSIIMAMAIAVSRVMNPLRA